MSLLLVSVGGEHKGSLWSLSGKPLTIGRSPECDIALGGPTVSRRHCRLYVEGGAAHIEDLGSRNLALVNGQAARKRTLAPGDEIMLGREHFVVVCVSDRSPIGEMPSDLLPQTVDWDRIASEGKDGEALRFRPRTVQDLADLFEAASEFSRCADPSSLLAAVRLCLRRYYDPEALWIFRARESLAVETEAEPASIQTLAASCVREKRAILQRLGAADVQQVETLLYAAPVTFDDALLAVIAVRTRTDRGVHPEGGLSFLALFAASLGAALYSAEQRESLRRENDRFLARMGESKTLIGSSAVMEALRAQIMRAARADINVLITGETGSGKELIARSLHAHSRRNKGPLVIVNCAAIPRELFESELFGHTKGAFTGATSAAPGLLTQADGGMLFLDEVADLSLENQARILRVVENGAFRPVGASRDAQVDLCIAAATNRNLEEMAQAGLFRADLFHRLNGVHLHAPPLRERTEDIPELVEHFLRVFQDRLDKTPPSFSPEALKALRTHVWPGNVRELRQTMHRALALTDGDVIGVEELFPSTMMYVASPSSELYPASLQEIEKQHILSTLRHCGGNVRMAAQFLGVSRTTLYSKVSAYGIRL